MGARRWFLIVAPGYEHHGKRCKVLSVREQRRTGIRWVQVLTDDGYITEITSRQIAEIPVEKRGA